MVGSRHIPRSRPPWSFPSLFPLWRCSSTCTPTTSFSADSVFVKCQVRFCSRGFFGRWVESPNDAAEKKRHTSSERVSARLSCPSPFAVMYSIGTREFDFALSHRYTAGSHASVSASQARIEDVPCYFIVCQSMQCEGSWCNVPLRGFYFWNNAVWQVHMNKCVIRYFPIQSFFCFSWQLRKQRKDSVDESFCCCCICSSLSSVSRRSVLRITLHLGSDAFNIWDLSWINKCAWH